MRTVADPLEITFLMTYRIWFALRAYLLTEVIWSLESKPATQHTEQTHAYQAELGRHGFWDGLGNHFNLLELLRRPTVIDMTDDGCGCFFLVFKNGKPNHWVGDSGVEKDMEEMVEFITDELTGEFKFTQF